MPLRTEYEVLCPCCGATLVIDEGLKRVVRHVEPERADKPKLDDAHQILADAKAAARGAVRAVRAVGENPRRRAVPAFRRGAEAGERSAGDEA